ncbi:homoserine dehydrogenase [Ruania suaedae]|uniref:homoserine dehydrogenase n=1 Tax=Ruania suaedae TaxID=2897774 RepID=UPI001E60A352|nr:homoserine dehydrogenase [Ruania suaedae]UFU02882.1 homoserine dehydrogenase [Ruania suaedae]
MADPSAPIRVAVSGAAGGFAGTLLPHLEEQADLEVTVLLDRDVDAARRLAERHGGPQVLADPAELDPGRYDVLVEATGHTATGHRSAASAIAAGRSVVMVTKETMATTGPALTRAAAEAGVRLLSADGDQPANLAALLAWAHARGLRVVAAGKAAEYDVVLHPDGSVGHDAARVPDPGLAQAWGRGERTVADVLAARADALRGLPLRSAADVCEMVLASHLTGLPTDTPALHYPAVRPHELADVYAATEEGGIRTAAPVLDVATMLRREDEPSIAGGVFVIARVPDASTAQVLAGKGHVVSRDGRYLAVIWPHHLMGLETVATIRAAAGREQEGHHAPRERTGLPLAAMYGVAGHDLSAGSRFEVRGHHHEIEGLQGRISTGPHEDLAPFYLLDGAELRHDLPAGEPVRLGNIRGIDPDLLAAATKGEGR